jgi:hypothetical protein
MKYLTNFLGIVFLTCLAITGSSQAETMTKGAQKGAVKSTTVPVLSATMKNEVFAVAMAGRIAQECHRLYILNVKQADLVYSQMDSVMRKQGFSERNQADLTLAIPNHTIESKAQAYFRKRNLRENSSSSWCSAGQAEISQKTMIGKYLLPK